MKKPSLLFGILDNGMGLVRSSYSLSMFALGLSSVLRDREVSIQSISYPYPDGILNMLCAAFLRSNNDELIIIDGDIVFTPEHVEILLSHDAPIVFGLYPKKQPGLEFPVVALPGDENPFADDGRGPLREVACCARGFMRAHRSVFETLKPHVETYECAQTGKQNSLFWKTLPGGHSEDFAFCNLAREHGYKILVDTRVVTQHEGSALYPIPGTY